MALGRKRPQKVYRSRKKRFPVRGMLYLFALLLLVGAGYFGAGFVRDWLRSPNRKPVSDTSSVLPLDGGNEQEQSHQEESSSLDQQEPGQEPWPAAVMPDQYRQEGYQEYFAALYADGYRAVVMDWKDEDGIVWFDSPSAREYDAVAPSEADVRQLAAAAQDAGLVPIARIHTLRDRTAPHASRANSYLASGTSSTWLDSSKDKGGRPWLNPFLQPAQEYIASLCRELSDAGFRMILLDSLQFPDKQIRLDAGDEYTGRSAVLGELLGTARAAVGEDTEVLPVIDETLWRERGDIVYGSTITEISSKAVVVVASGSQPGESLLDTLELDAAVWMIDSSDRDLLPEGAEGILIQ